ncbi:hypothetical protein OE88DRAFT_1662536 [Heliocybe sulcata]|uniref:Uncharacterized protein n=1 Tax=Heliocybe sulcata TaxID=5364 RepID=A0A5C3MXX4_9AGAM|nr:hypothetical protein OE88DRAFT_1662536 [Heliocybe sulcata]
MGSYFSVINDSEDTVWITYGVNQNALKITATVLTGVGALAAAVPTSGAAVAALPVYGASLAAISRAPHIRMAASYVAKSAMTLTGAVGYLDQRSSRPQIPRRHAALHEIEALLTQAGMRRLSPGETFTSGKLSLSLIQQAEVVIVQKNERGGLTITTGHFTVWTGPTHDSNQSYKISDRLYCLEDRDTINIS